MLNINSYSEDSLEFYNAIVRGKRSTENNPNLREDLADIQVSQAQRFAIYRDLFNENALESIVQANYPHAKKMALAGLYSYKSKHIKSLKNFLTHHPLFPDRILNTCQNCTINEVSSFDHVLPKTDYPDYSVNPLNLFPCCSVCNSKKLDRFTNDTGDRIFLNLYTDKLPNKEYLFARFDDKNLPVFFLQNINGVSADLYSLIENHYRNLELLERFRAASHEHLGYLSSVIRMLETREIEVIKSKISGLIHDLSRSLGFNHRQIVLYKAVINSDDVLNILING